MPIRLNFVIILLLLPLLYCCEAFLVPQTSDPAQKVNDAFYLIDVGRPIPAERLIRDSIDIYKKSNDEKGLSQAYFAYGYFFCSKAVENWSKYYKFSGFHEDTASYENRLDVSSQFLTKAELIAVKYNDFKTLTGIHQVRAINYIASGKKNQACEEYAFSLETYRKYKSDNPEDKSWIDKKYKRYDEYLLAEMKSLGCMGHDYGNLGQYQQAIEDLNKTISLKPDYADAYNSRGNAYGNLGQYRQAIEDYNKAIGLKPDYADAYNSRGTAYAKLGQYRQAIEDYNKAIGLKPDYADAYNNRGNAYLERGNYQQAIENYNKAIEINPKVAYAYCNRGIAYADLGNYKQAIEDYNKAIEINPKDADTYHNKGVAYYKLGNYQQAIEDYNKAIEINPKDANAYHKRGVAYYKLGNHQQAIEDFKIAARLGHKESQDYLRSKGIVW